jgi:hypothetical protein
VLLALKRLLVKEMPRWLFVTFFVITFLNASSYMLFSEFIGGDASAGRVEDGHYYVGEHGDLTEVSKTAFQYNEIQGYSVWVTTFALIGTAVYLKRRKKL